VVRGDSEITVLLTNFALPRHPIAVEQVRMKLLNVRRPASARLRRIDHDHANAKRAWLEMGAPEYLSAAVVSGLNAASEMTGEPQEFTFDGGAIAFTAVLMPLSVAAVTLLYGGATIV